MATDYNSTLNLPKTDFPMKAGLPQREPEFLKDWEDDNLYEEIINKNEGKELYVLHDGPPFANGDIHLGTAMNKVLKDFIVKYKNMNGYKAPFVPGWDTHGLPIELKAVKKLAKDKASLTPLDIRSACYDYANSYIDIQRNQFKRLGVIGDYKDPYLTLKPEFEAKEIQIFGDMYKKGYIYKGLKPVYWCPNCETALAEAEIEYEDIPCDSIYVKFAVKDDKGVLTGLGVDPNKTYFVIWTTTTWTLPGNLAVCLGPEYNYSFVKCGEEIYVIATELIKSVMTDAGISDYEVVAEAKGSDLELIDCQHPFIDRVSKVIVGSHVTLDSGTGCVHTAPGFGVEDFEVCNHYKDIDIIVPVNSKGRMTAEAGKFEGLTTNEANVEILKDIKESGALLAEKKIQHQYPHCWRCKNPIIFRATEQWFCSIEKFKKEALEAVHGVQWIPDWGEGKIAGMISDRSDWCISRQRNWGVPFPIFFCKNCNKDYLTDESINKVSAIFAKEGADSWWKYPVEELLPEGAECPVCKCKEFYKETDTMDGWFDSGVTHAAVLMEREDLKWPADLYLEGNDQYRGWFQSSLLTSVAWTGKSPYKAVCTHGWVVDGEGKKMSKSLGNGIVPEDIIKQYGADLLRLWVASSNYHSDVRISKQILTQLSEVYRKIRNTARFILGNLNDFNPDKDMVSVENLTDIDKWALYKLNELIDKCKTSYDNFDFHIIYHAVHNYCVVDLSNFYLDICKDRLYVEAADSASRRAAQTTIYKILVALTKLLAPILSFTADEIWRFLPKTSEYSNVKSVMLTDMPEKTDICVNDEFLNKFETIHALRDEVKKALEIARADKVIGSSLESKITLFTKDAGLNAFISENIDSLAEIFITSAVELVADGKGAYVAEDIDLSVNVEKADGEKCERCWSFSKTVGEDSDHPTLCKRCRNIIG